MFSMRILLSYVPGPGRGGLFENDTMSFNFQDVAEGRKVTHIRRFDHVRWNSIDYTLHIALTAILPAGYYVALHRSGITNERWAGTGDQRDRICIRPEL